MTIDFKFTRRRLARTAAAMVAVGAASLSAQAAFVTLPVVGTPTTTLTPCNPKDAAGNQSPSLTTCKVDGLPGSAAVPGYILRASRSAPITINGVTVGTLYDRVWCTGSGSTCDASNTYILGMRVQMNANNWSTATPGAFEVNDLFRSIRAAASADVAYYVGSAAGGSSPDTALATKFLEFTGRTNQGLNEGGTSTVKQTNNGRVDFRADANAADPDGDSSPWSPWMLVRQNCAAGFATTPLAQAVRVWQGGEEDQPPQQIQTSGYQCNN